METLIDKFNIFILNAIKRPAMVSVSNIEDLYVLCKGYIFAFHADNFDILFNHIMLDYRAYMNKQIKVGYDCDWHRLIRLMASSDKNSLEIFEKTYTNFLEKKKIKIPEVK